MRPTHLAIIIALVVAGFAAMSSMFTVHQAKQALVLQFGNVKRLVNEPGLHFKIPMVQDVVYFDKRVLDFDARAEEVPTLDQKQLVVDSFARYRIVDPLKFFQTVNNELGMEVRLGNVINANLRATFGEVGLATLLTPERARLMQIIADLVKAQSVEFGIDVIDVRIKRIDLPDENSQAIFRRMQTQREQKRARSAPRARRNPSASAPRPTRRSRSSRRMPSAPARSFAARARPRRRRPTTTPTAATRSSSTSGSR